MLLKVRWKHKHGNRSKMICSFGILLSIDNIHCICKYNHFSEEKLKHFSEEEFFIKSSKNSTCGKQKIDGGMW